MPANQSKGADKKGSAFFSERLQTFFARLPERSKKIVEARFGITSGEPQTLEEIGKSYQITRERVRQVMNTALGYLSQEREHPQMVEVKNLIESTLRDKSGIMKADELLEKLSHGSQKERGALLVFLECLPSVKEERENDEHEHIYRLKDFSMSRWKKVSDAAEAILKEAGEALDGKNLFARFQGKSEDVSEKEFFDFLSVSAQVKQNVFGKWGLSQWSEIKPRGTREKAHLVLKTVGKPLHFREIARLIDEYGLKGKKQKSHPQTVHNELIKDKRFVLVGRGIYALSEWGYKKGTVKEVLEEILRASGKPLKRDEVLDRVLKVRQVKKSTIIINLNTFFTRVGKDAYTLKNAK